MGYQAGAEQARTPPQITSLFATHMLESSGDFRGCRSYWVMPISPQLKLIPILIFNTWLQCTMRRIRAPNGGNNAFLLAFGRISALTFDLDDTLYDNRPVITRTEQEALAFVQNYHPALRSSKIATYSACARPFVSGTGDLSRRYPMASPGRRTRDAGGGAECREAKTGANAAMMNFAKWRSRIEVPQTTHDTLKALARKWPLVAITNGNAQPELFRLGDHFSLCCAPVPDGQSKPFSDMYTLAAEKLKMPVGEILHVGDDLTTDVAGAIRCGMQACWIKRENADLMHTADSRLLPHIEISQLASLTSLI
ncbi:5-amino-6-(5-phospho-D-ribitylamino)uracil phosphatase YigB [Shigella flexneri]